MQTGETPSFDLVVQSCGLVFIMYSLCSGLVSIVVVIVSLSNNNLVY